MHQRFIGVQPNDLAYSSLQEFLLDSSHYNVTFCQILPETSLQNDWSFTMAFLPTKHGRFNH